MVTQYLRESIIKYESVFMNSDFCDHVPVCIEMQIYVSYHETFVASDMCFPKTEFTPVSHKDRCQ